MSVHLDYLCLPVDQETIPIKAIYMQTPPSLVQKHKTKQKHYDTSAFKYCKLLRAAMPELLALALWSVCYLGKFNL